MGLIGHSLSGYLCSLWSSASAGQGGDGTLQQLF